MAHFDFLTWTILFTPRNPNGWAVEAAVGILQVVSGVFRISFAMAL